MTELEYFKGDELAANVWRSKYASSGEKSPDDMHRRMAKEFARIEEKYHKEELDDPSTLAKLSDYGYNRMPLKEFDIYNLFKDFKYIVPQGSIMSSLGADHISSLSNCFVIGQPEDSYGGIMQKDEQLVQLMKRRGGVGIDISTLRPKGTEVTNAAKTSTGAVSFMERFSNSTREVAQGGRRGALMLTIDCRHPDVFDFVNIKKDRTKVTGANISVMLRDDFMEAVKKDEDYILRFPCESVLSLDLSTIAKESTIEDHLSNISYNELFTDSKGILFKKIKAKELYDSIVENAWENAEPGQMFVDRHHDYSPDSVYPQYKGVTTNPCGEIFMQPYDSCRLMALNLYSFVDNPFTDKATFDFDKLYKVAYEQQRLADDLVDLELEHISRILAKIHSDNLSDDVKRVEIELWEKVYDVAKNGRRTGCGFTALGDALAALNIKYDKCQIVLEEIMYNKMKGELDCTIDLAILRGTFDGWDWKNEYSTDGKTYIKPKNDFYKFLTFAFSKQAIRMSKYGRRNISFSTVAPTGTVSLMTQTTSGLEPLFMPYYMRRKKVNPSDKDVRVDFTDQNGDQWQEFPVLHPKFRDWIEVNTFDFKGNKDFNEFMSKIDKTELERLFKESPWYGSTANDIDWLSRIDIQAIIQKYVSHSISSTINLPTNVTKEEVSNIYLRAYDKKLKGVTIYRDGCRTGVLVNTETKNKEEFTYHDAPKRPKSLPVNIGMITSRRFPWNVIVGMFDNKPYEVFAVPQFTDETTGHLVKRSRGRYDLLKEDGSLLKADITKNMTGDEALTSRLVSTSLRHGANITFVIEQLMKSEGDITSFSKAIARGLKVYADHDLMASRATCNDCGSSNLRYEEGCLKCNDCGNSKCG